MGAQENGLTLEGLAHRLEGQTRRLEALERENATLRREVATLRDPETARRAAEWPPETDGPVSRRALLGKAAAAAVAVTAAGTLLSPREARAETFASVQSNSFVSANTFVIGNNGVSGLINTANGPAVSGANDGSGAGVSGNGGHNGVRGTARDSDGYGVEGEGDTGVHGHTTKTGYSGVYGLHQGSAGYGVVGDGTGTGAGVLGRNAGGAGVEARDSRYGGKFDGSRAQLLLEPKNSAGRPTSGNHTKGELYMDSAGTLFVCVASGNPGTWRNFQTLAA